MAGKDVSQVRPHPFARRAGARACIAGIGVTTLSRDSGKTESQMAVEAILAAVKDSGLDLGSIDGIVKYSADSTKESTLVDVLGLERIKFHAEVGYGGTATVGSIALAEAAIAAGQANCIVCFRAMNGRSGMRFGRGERMLKSTAPGIATTDGTRTFGGALTGPFGLLSPSQMMGLWARRYAHECGFDDAKLTRGLAAVAMTQRAYAAKNVGAVLGGRPLSLDDYMSSRMIAEPLRLPDFCLEVDGGAAIIVVAADLAADAARRPVPILAVDRNLERGGDTPTLYHDRLDRLVSEHARDIFTIAGIAPEDVDVAGIYDATSVMVLMALEDYGFCGRGEAVDFAVSGQLGPGGQLPTNTNGGMLSEGYLHGINNLLEVVRQMRGESANQVADARIGFYTVGNGSLLLGGA